MNDSTHTIKNKMMPKSFRPLLWSYNFSTIDPQKNKRIIVINTINYGDLNHWRWLVQFYGKEEIVNVLTKISATELRPRARRLAAIIFGVKKFNYAPRSTK